MCAKGVFIKSTLWKFIVLIVTMELLSCNDGVIINCCFYRCNVAVMLLQDVVVDVVAVDWSIHLPLMLHVLFLGLDHSRSLVSSHCKQLLTNLLIVLADHNDHLGIAQILLNRKTSLLNLGITTPPINVTPHNFTGNFKYYCSPDLPISR